MPLNVRNYVPKIVILQIPFVTVGLKHVNVSLGLQVPIVKLTYVLRLDVTIMEHVLLNTLASLCQSQAVIMRVYVTMDGLDRYASLILVMERRARVMASVLHLGQMELSVVVILDFQVTSVKRHAMTHVMEITHIDVQLQ